MRTPILLPICLVLALACGCTRRDIPQQSRGPLVRTPARRPAPANPTPGAPGAFTSNGFGYQVQPPQGWQAAATGGNADPTTSPDVFFRPPGGAASQDEYLAVRICQQPTPEACLPAGGTRISDRQATLGGAPAREVVDSRSTGDRRWQETHTLASRGGRIYDVIASTPIAGGENAQKLYPAFRESFRWVP